MVCRTSQTQARKLITPAGPIPLAVGRDPSHVTGEGVPLHVVELSQFIEVTGAWDDASTVTKFSGALTTALEAERYLRIFQLSDGCEGW